MTSILSIEEIVKEFEPYAESCFGCTVTNCTAHRFNAADRIAWLRSTLTTHNKALIERIEGIKRDGSGTNAIPETDDYANGWNDCRKEAYKNRQKALDQVIAEINKTYESGN